MIWIVSAVALPQATHIGSAMQQRVQLVKSSDLLNVRGFLEEMRDLRAVIWFTAASKDDRATVLSFSEPAFNISESSWYCQTGILTGIFFGNAKEEGRKCHTINWSSSEQPRINHSSYGTEILACTEAGDITSSRHSHIPCKIGKWNMSSNLTRKVFMIW